MDLFGWAETHARKVDPVTSKIGAIGIAQKLNPLCMEFLGRLGELGPSTAKEVAVSITTDFGRVESLRRRASDLEAIGLIRVVGVRKCKVTGKTAQVYEVVLDDNGNS